MPVNFAEMINWIKVFLSKLILQSHDSFLKMLHQSPLLPKISFASKLLRLEAKDKNKGYKRQLSFWKSSWYPKTRSLTCRDKIPFKPLTTIPTTLSFKDRAPNGIQAMKLTDLARLTVLQIGLSYFPNKICTGSNKPIAQSLWIICWEVLWHLSFILLYR